MRICFISHSAKKSGAERSLLETIEAFRNSGVECLVLFPKKGPLIKNIVDLNIPYVVIPYKHWAAKKSIIDRMARITINLLMFFPVVYTILKYKCDIVYTNTITVPIGAFAAKLLGKPHVWHIREYVHEHHGFILDLGDKLSLWLVNKLSSACIVNSKAIFKKYEEYIDSEKIHLVYQAVTLENKKNNEFNYDFYNDIDIVCAVIGSLSKNKKQEEAIYAAENLKRDGIKIKLFIVGDGNPEYKENLYKLTSEKKLEDCIIFTGYIDNPLGILRHTDLVIVCSRYEAFGRVTIEAMRMAKPVIGARSGGTAELIQDGENGFLYTPGDYNELSEKIKFIANNKLLANQMGLHGQKWVERTFSEKRYQEDLLKVIALLIKS